jgi:tripartite-type tricarboxylate transporter receptor subunit TctC
LATTGSRRSEFLPDVPTIAESRYPQFKWLVWAGLLAPAGTPAEKVENVNRALTKAIKEPAMKARFMQLGISPRSMSRAQFDRLLEDDWSGASQLINQFELTED